MIQVRLSLTDAGVELIQGYFYARPMSAGQLVRWQLSATLAS
ncbi:hypothetical protein [Thiomonas sp.]